jgi:hypothetical protein
VELQACGRGGALAGDLVVVGRHSRRWCSPKRPRAPVPAVVRASRGVAARPGTEAHRRCSDDGANRDQSPSFVSCFAPAVDWKERETESR